MSIRSSRKLSLAAVLLAGASFTVTTTAWAQEAADEGVADIVVYAQKRAQNLQDVGVSVTALGAQALKMVARNDATALATSVPSLQVNQYSPALTVFNLRGVSQNDFSDTQEAPVAFYNDEVYIASPGAVAGQTFDVERVEVLRGPQGTLFGRNATGGLVQMMTAKPTKELDGYVTAGVGSYGQFTSEGAISGPLSDTLRARIAFTTDHHDGYVKNVYPGSEDGGDSKFWAVRGQIAADVADRGKLNLKIEYMRNDHESSGALAGVPAKQDADGLGVALGQNENFYGTCGGCTYSGFKPSSDPFTSNLNQPGNFNRKYLSMTGRYEHDLDFATLTAITNYQKLDKQYAEDTDGTPDSLLEIASTQDFYQLSQELRLAGKTDRLNWVVGAYGLKINTDNTAGAYVDPGLSEFFAGVPSGTFASVTAFSAQQTTKTLAFFAQGEYKLNDVFTAIVGGRYSADWKKFDFFNANTDPSGFFVFGTYDFGARAPDLTKKKFENWSGKIELDAKPNDDTLLYVSVNRGTKGGGYNTPNVIPTFLFFPDPTDLANALTAFDQQMTFKQEVLTSYEGGFKLTLADRKVTFNGAVFHYDYKNYQAFQQRVGSQFIVNVPAKVTGFELELTARPLSRLNLSAFLTHLFEAKVKDVALPGSGRVVDRSLPQAPDWSLGGSLSYALPIGEYGDLTLATNWKYDTSQYFSVFNAPVDYEKSHLVGNVRVSFAPPSDKWEAAFFVNNVTDKEYRVFSSDNSFTTVAESVYARPRWFGGSLTFRFGK